MKNTEEILELIRSRSQLPSHGDIRYNDNTEILSLLNSTLQNDIYPLILERDEGYYRSYQDFSLSDSQKSFEIPLDSFNRSVYEIVFIDKNKKRINVPRINIISKNKGFEILGNKIILRNFSSQYLLNKQLRIYYYPKLLPLCLDHAELSQTITNENSISLQYSGLDFIAEDIIYFQSKEDPFLFEKTKIIAVGDLHGESIFTPESIPKSFALKSADIITKAEDGLFYAPITDILADMLIIKTSLNLAIDESTRSILNREFAEKVFFFKENTFSRVEKEQISLSHFNALWQ